MPKVECIVTGKRVVVEPKDLSYKTDENREMLGVCRESGCRENCLHEAWVKGEKMLAIRMRDVD